MLDRGGGKFRHYAGYLFDLDGTLIDTAPDLTFALNHALAEFGHQGGGGRAAAAVADGSEASDRHGGA